MFEKLREYGLYIIIGVISLGLLGMYFINTTNSKKGVKYFDDVQVGFLNATAINSTAKKEIKGTINDYIKLSNKQFGNYKINDDFGIVVLKGTNAKDVVVDGKFNIITKCDYLDKLYKDEEKKREIVNEKNLIQIIIPVNGDNLLNDSDIEGVKDETYIIKKNKIITCSGKEIDVKGKSEEERGFFDSALFGLGFFKDKSEAKGFKDKYLNANGMLVESDTTPFVVFDVNGSIPNIMKTEYRSGNVNNNNGGSGTINSDDTGGNQDGDVPGTDDPAANEEDKSEEKNYKFFINFEDLEDYKNEISSNCEHKIIDKDGKKVVELIFGENERCDIYPGTKQLVISGFDKNSGYELEDVEIKGIEINKEYTRKYEEYHKQCSSYLDKYREKYGEFHVERDGYETYSRHRGTYERKKRIGDEISKEEIKEYNEYREKYDERHNQRYEEVGTYYYGDDKYDEYNEKNHDKYCERNIDRFYEHKKVKNIDINSFKNKAIYFKKSGNIKKDIFIKAKMNKVCVVDWVYTIDGRHFYEAGNNNLLVGSKKGTITEAFKFIRGGFVYKNKTYYHSSRWDGYEHITRDFGVRFDVDFICKENGDVVITKSKLINKGDLKKSYISEELEDKEHIIQTDSFIIKGNTFDDKPYKDIEYTHARVFDKFKKKVQYK